MSDIGFFVLYSFAMMVVGVGLLFIAGGTNNRSRMLGLLLLVFSALLAFFMGHPIVQVLP